MLLSPAPSLDFALFLDVDGTLIEFADSPADIPADDSLTRLLGGLADRLGGAVALVSGRPIEFLDALFAPLTLPTAGLHGIERRRASGIMQGASHIDTRLDAARSALSHFVAEHAGTFLEDKRRSVALHYRRGPQFESAARAAIDALAAPLAPTYHVQEGDMVFELKPRGFTKEAAVREFLREPPFTGRIPVMLGDDLTDAAALRAVESCGGISIAVGGRITGQWSLEGPRQVRQWLESIATLEDSNRA
jgi:trehalose 6-phosphate phosphatase